MPDAALRAALLRLAACDGRLPVDPGRDVAALRDDGWIRSHELLDPEPWPPIARDYAAGIGSGRTAVGGSCALQGYAWRIAGLAIGTWALTGAVLDVTPQRVWVRMEDGRTVGVAAPDPRATPARAPEALADALLTGHLAPVVAASRTASGLSQRVAWGNVASACASVLGLLDRALPTELRPGWRADAARFLDAPAWPSRDLVGLVRVAGPEGDVLTHERRTCCLMRLAPGKGECGSCERLTSAERLARLARNAAEAPAPGRLVPA